MVMVVCVHRPEDGIRDFCSKHGMKILDSYLGGLEDYKGSCPVVVSSEDMDRMEYDRLKCLLFGRGVELVSTKWTDDETILRMLSHQIDQRKKRGGRQKFGFYQKNGIVTEIPELMAVARRVIELRDRGYRLKEISMDSRVCYLDGRPLSLSTVQLIVKNREIYEK